jgi:putative transposase
MNSRSSNCITFCRFASAESRTRNASRRANCWDNAVAESFFGAFKNELIYRRPWLTREDARDAIAEYIEIFYNRIRRHSTIGNLSPVAFEEMDQATRACAA